LSAKEWEEKVLPYYTVNAEIFSKIFRGCAPVQKKSRKSKMSKNELKHTQTITQVHMEGF